MPSARSSSRRDAVPIALIIVPRRPMRMPFWDSVSTHRSACTVDEPSSRSMISSTWTSTACGTSWRVRCSTCSRTSSASRTCSGWSEISSSGNRNGPSGASETRCSSSGPMPLPRAGGDREDLGVEAEVGGRLQRRDRAGAVEPVDLVDGDHRRDAGAAQRLGDEAVAGAADALLAVEQEQHGVGLGELVLDAPLHALGQRVARALDARQVGRARAASRRAGWRRRGSRGAWSAACRRRSRPSGRRAR